MGDESIRLASATGAVEKLDVELKVSVDGKLRRRLLPLLFLGALICYVDRTNISFAALQMNRELWLTHRQYGMAAGLFFITYSLFAVPSTLVVKRVGPHRGLPVILTLWGVASGAMAVAQSAKQLYALRLALGAAQAAFFPSTVYYLTLWFSQAEMALTYATVRTATAASGIVGGFLAGTIMRYTDHFSNVRGWRWMFALEAAPAFALALIMLLVLDSEPSHATFLNIEEREWLACRQRTGRDDSTARESGSGNGLIHALRLPWLWLLIAIWLLYSCGYYGVIFWLPLLIKSMGTNDELKVGLLSAIPYVAAVGTMLVVARSSDRSGERRMHLAGCAYLAAGGFFSAAAIHARYENTKAPLLACLSVAAAGVWAMFGPYWAIPTAMLSGDSAAAAFAVINSVGVLGGFIGPWLVGVIREKTGSFNGALVAFGVILSLSGTLSLCLRVNSGPRSDRSSIKAMESTAYSALQNSEDW